jgi:hypothetical protein
MVYKIILNERERERESNADRFIQAGLEMGSDAGRRHLSSSRKFLNEKFEKP